MILFHDYLLSLLLLSKTFLSVQMKMFTVKTVKTVKIKRNSSSCSILATVHFAINFYWLFTWGIKWRILRTPLTTDIVSFDSNVNFPRLFWSGFSKFFLKPNPIYMLIDRLELRNCVKKKKSENEHFWVWQVLDSKGLIFACVYRASFSVRIVRDRNYFRNLP